MLLGRIGRVAPPKAWVVLARPLVRELVRIAIAHAPLVAQVTLHEGGVLKGAALWLIELDHHRLEREALAQLAGLFLRPRPTKLRLVLAEAALSAVLTHQAGSTLAAADSPLDLSLL